MLQARSAAGMVGLNSECALLYHLPLVHWWGTTVGKALFGLRVVRLWTDGTLPPSWKDTFLREFDRAAFLSIPVLNILVALILLAQMAKDRGRYHQSKYDRVARTVVVRRRAVRAQAGLRPTAP
ncbi:MULTISPECIES: RDD family protein [unclassified Streptomyces]|uniref:RDD family protein n=1 Tax=unclassified Streptomyces TaxID=2593676 RepID=UPI003822E30D